MALVRSCVAGPRLPPLLLPRYSYSSFGASWKGRLQRSCGTAGVHLDGRRIAGKVRRPTALAALPDLHSLAFLADFFDLHWFDPELDPSKFAVGIHVDPTRVIITERYSNHLSEEAIKTFYMVFSLVFCWGCCVFGSMNDEFYDSDLYRDAGGNGTGHWIYDQEEREEMLARQEMWSEDLLMEIEEKAEEVRQSEEMEKGLLPK